MDIGCTSKVEELRRRVSDFMDDYIVPMIYQYNGEAALGNAVTPLRRRLVFISSHSLRNAE